LKNAGARAVVRNCAGKSDPLSLWLNSLLERKHPNVVATALANKTARIAWAMLSTGQEYNPALLAA
jgi:transposase